METELRDTSEKLRKTMEQQARQQSDYMTTKEQLNSTEKAKVREISPIKKCFHNTLLHHCRNITGRCSTNTVCFGNPSERPHHSTGGRPSQLC